MLLKNDSRIRKLNVNIYPNILHVEVDADADAGGYSKSSSALKCRRAKNRDTVTLIFANDEGDYTVVFAYAGLETFKHFNFKLYWRRAC